MNMEKTQTIKFTTEVFKQENLVKFLGLHLDSDLKWNQHVDEVNKKLSRILYCLRRLTKIAAYQSVVSAYHSLFHNTATYGILAWGASAAANFLFLYTYLRTVRL